MRCELHAKSQKHNPCKTEARVFPPLLLVGSQESVLKVPKRGQFHAAIRVKPKCCDSCAQGPRCARETDGIAAKLLRCGIASEVLRRSMPLRFGGVGGGVQHWCEREAKRQWCEREAKRSAVSRLPLLRLSKGYLAESPYRVLVSSLPSHHCNQQSPRQTTQKKGPNRKVHEFRPFLCEFWCFFFFRLGKQSAIHIELWFRFAPGKSS